MSDSKALTRETPTRGPARPLPYIVAGILLVVAIVLPLMPQMYSFDKPRLGGMPFFYWYQLIWVPVSAALSGIAYLLVTGEDRRRRRAARADSPGDDESPGSPGSGASAAEGPDGGGRHVAPSSDAPTRTEATGETTGNTTDETAREGDEPR